MTEPDADERPWYDEGLRFQCGRCLGCCRLPGHVWVDRREIRALARRFGLSLDDFGRRYLRQVGRRYSLTDRRDGACVFLGDDGCTVYEDRPRQCRTFPFWHSHLESPDGWALAARVCPGVDRGPTYTRAEIEALRDGAGATGPSTACQRCHDEEPR